MRIGVYLGIVDGTNENITEVLEAIGCYPSGLEPDVLGTAPLPSSVQDHSPQIQNSPLPGRGQRFFSARSLLGSVGSMSSAAFWCSAGEQSLVPAFWSSRGEHQLYQGVDIGKVSLDHRGERRESVSET